MKSPQELMDENRALRAELAALRGLAWEQALAADRPLGPGRGDAAQLRSAWRSAQESEQLFAAALDAVQECFAILSAVRDGAGRIVDFRFEYINPAGARNNGRAVEDHFGRTVLELLPGHAAGPLLARYAKVVETGESLRLTDVVHRDTYGGQSETRLFDVRVVRFNDGIIATWQDVTERHASEVALRQVVDTIPQFVATARADGSIDYLNDRLVTYCGFSLEELQGAGWQRCVHPDDLEAVRESWVRALATGEDRIVEQRVRRYDGVYRWFVAHYRPFRNGRGEITQWVGTLTDIHDRKEAQLQLRDSEARFREMADTMPQIVWTARPDGFLDYYNRRWYEMGTAEGTYGDPSWAPVIHPDDLEAVSERWRTAVRTGEPMRNNEQRLLDRRTGEYRWHIGRAVPVRDTAGTILRWIGTTTDIHDLKVAQADVREQGERLAAAIAASGTGTFRWNIRTDELTWDENLDRLFGLRPGETARSLEQFVAMVHPDDRQGVIDRCRRCRDEGADFDMEFRVVWPDGSVRWLEDKGKTFFDAADGGPAYMTGACVDVTVRRAAGDALRESGARFRQLADAMPQMVWVTRPDGHHEYYNRRWYEFTGVSEGSTDGEAWNDVLHPDDRERAWATWRRSLDSGEPYEIEYRLRHCSGEYRWALGRALAIRNERGEVERWFGTCTDVDAMKRLMAEREQLLASERRAREEAEAASRAKDEFLAALSHELRTPLTPVMVTAQMLEDDHSLSAEVRHDLGIIRRNVELETRLIDDLLDLTRVSRGKLTLNLDRVDVHAVLRDAMRTCSDDVAAQKRLDVRLEAGAVNHYVRGDAARLSQIFWNLIKNAVKFTPAGGSIVLRTANPSADVLAVSVSDTGVGIEAEVLPLVFNAFEQGGAAVTRKFGGLGLGLAICRALAELHGGRIEARSDGAGLGATFTLTLPATAATPADRVAGATRAAVEAVRGRAGAAVAPNGRRRLLLVEDHEQTAKALRRLLTNLGYVVEWRASVAEALEAAGRESFDLVLSDIGLPDGSGLELMRALRERHRLSGIALSGYGMEQDLASSAAAGFLEHLVKPISKDLLGAALRRHLV